ncbi:hypothetical protein I5S86_19210 [Priestia aryabhattai]|nr:hypothetical protein I5S86_19210 [Priestia aryabhattai]
MSTPASASSGRTGLGRFLIRTAVGAGRMMQRLETKVLHSRILVSVPCKYRRFGLQVIKLLLVLAVASVALFLAIGMVALWAMAALPITASDDEESGVHQVSHPQHQHKYPELYDEYGALK